MKASVKKNAYAHTNPWLTSTNLRHYEITTTSVSMSSKTSKTINYTEPVFIEELENLCVYGATSFLVNLGDLKSSFEVKDGIIQEVVESLTPLLS